MNLEDIIPTILIILGLIIIIVCFSFILSPITKHKTNCYDRYGNKIINQVCEENYYGGKSEAEIYTIVSIGFMCCMVGAIIFFFIDSWRFK